MDRTERQKLGIRRWLDVNGCGTLCYGTGVGKTYTTIMLIQSFYKRNPNFSVLVAVPTDVLKDQWNRELAKHKLFSVCKVETFHTIVKNTYSVDLLVVDEVHAVACPVWVHIFICVKYKYVLGLTATWERLDGNHELLENICPPCDIITLKEALENGWVSPYRNYKVLINVDLTEYYEINRRFQSIFALFGHDFKLVMSLIKDKRKAKIWAKNSGYGEQQIRGYLAAFMKLLKARKSFVMSHPKKFEIANKILDARLDKKCIVFTATVKDAESFKKRGLVCHSQRKKNENKKIIDLFNTMDKGLIVSPQALRTGIDIKGLSVGIALHCNSSELLHTQAIGRVCRLEENKIAEYFTLVIKDGIDERWFNNANKNQSYITITEDQLDLVLQGKEISTRPKKGIIDIEHRF